MKRPLTTDEQRTVWVALDIVGDWLKANVGQLDEGLSDSIQRAAGELETYLFVASAKCQ